jgi:hypothetical protein
VRGVRLGDPFVTLACALALGGMLAACDGADRRDAETVISAVTRFRSADLPSTPGAVEALKKTPCNAVEVCSARDACAAAGEALSRALQLKAEVARGLAAVENGTMAKDSAEAKALAPKLDEVESLLKRGQDGLPACDDQVRALKRKHRI